MKSLLICTLTLLMTILIGCTDASRKEAPVTIDLQHQEIPLPELIIGQSRGMVKKGNYLVVLDWSTQYFYHLIDLKTNEYKAKFIRKGQGPDDLIRPLNIHSLDNSSYIYSLDNGANIIRFHMDTISEQIKIEKYAKKEMVDFVFDFAPLSDTLFIGNGTFEDVMFKTYSPQKGFELSFGEYPYKDSEEKRISNRQRAMAYQGNIKANNRGRFAYATLSAEQIYFYELKGGQAIELGHVNEGFADYKPAGGKSGISVAHNALHPKAFIDLEVSDDYVYALYSGRTFAEYKLEEWLGKSIRVYDWYGNLKKEYQLDVPVHNICVDEKGKRIYAFANIPDPTLVYFDLPEE